MLRLVLAAVLVSACLAFPQRRDGAPAEGANLQSFGAGMMPNMQQMPAGQFLPFNPNFAGMGYKRAAEENPEERREHSNFHADSKLPFDSPEGGFGDFMNFMNENRDKLPFGNMDGAPAELGNLEPSSENDQEENQFRFFDQQQ
nr:TPA_inf: conotoxin precursor B2 [Conus ebraeus]